MTGDGVDQHRGTGAGDHYVVVAFRAFHPKFVLEAGAAAAFHAHAQHGTFRLALEDLADPPGRAFADCDVHVHLSTFDAPSYWRALNKIVKCAGATGQCWRDEREWRSKTGARAPAMAPL